VRPARQQTPFARWAPISAQRERLAHTVLVIICIYERGTMASPSAMPDMNSVIPTIGFRYTLLTVGIVLVHFLSWSLVLTHFNEDSLFGKRQYQFNRYYSTKTVHVHKVEDVHKISAPSHWESLGLIIPAGDENYKVKTYAIDKYGMVGNTSTCESQVTSACWLENSHGDYVFLNGESMSILSQISPSIYFGTLLTVYLLSSIDIVSNTMAYYFGKCSKYDAGDVEKVLRYVLIWINLLVYFFSILLAYGSTPFVNETKILGVKVEYSISSHLASIIPCVITLMLYLLHLRGRNLKRLDKQVIDQPVDKVPLQNDFDEGVSLAPMTLYTMLPQKSMNGVYFVNTSIKTTTGAWVWRDIFVLDPADKLNNEHPSGHMYYGPGSSEGSVVGAITVFLGGIGSLGLARGVVQEVELQLILGCTLGFAFLEICSHRLRAYWSFMFAQVQDLKGRDEDKFNKQMNAYFYGVSLIRFVVLWIQLWLLVLFYQTILHVKLAYSTPQTAIYALMFLYWSFSFLMYLDISGTILAPKAFNVSSQKMRYYFEMIFCLFALFVLFIVVISMLRYESTNNDLLQQDDLLVKYENIQYDLKNVNENKKCEKSGALKSNSLVHQDIKKNEGSWKIKDNWVGKNEVDAVELKVYYWTKGWNLQLLKMPTFVAWFCSNGLEHHWGQCLFSPNYFCGPSPQDIASTACDSSVVKVVKTDGTIVRFA
jgi:hypothetical protein